jgi:glycosyltransferase involved in cell wall biosynthesis
VYYNQVVRRALQKARKILTVSHSSKEDLMRIFNLNQDTIVVTYNGVDDRFRLDDTGLSKNKIQEVLAIQDPYILSVVNNKPHKNVATLIRAFDKFLGMTGISYRLVVVGIGQTARVLNDISNDILGKPFLFLPQVTDDELVALYQNAALFVLPTLYEGFCLPVLEAMACGTPVITSHVSSLPEVTGDAAVLIDPNNIDAIAQAIYNVLADSALQKELREKGIRQARRFSWEQSARQTLKVYEEVLLSD